MQVFFAFRVHLVLETNVFLRIYICDLEVLGVTELVDDEFHLAGEPEHDGCATIPRLWEVDPHQAMTALGIAPVRRQCQAACRGCETVEYLMNCKIVIADYACNMCRLVFM